MSTVAGALYAVRAMRLGVTVTDHWIEHRSLFVTRRVPWIAVRHVTTAGYVFTLDTYGLLARRVPMTPVGASPPFVDAIGIVVDRELMTRVVRRGVDQDLGPTGGAWTLTAAIAGFVLWMSLFGLAGTSMDGERYADREARSLSTGADVLDWQIEELDAAPWHETNATVRFETETGEVTADITRNGEYERQEVVIIVYDPELPTDTDFFDRPRWSRQQADARLGNAWASVFLVISSLSFALAALNAWRRHQRGAAR
jgi:hypothetical protein